MRLIDADDYRATLNIQRSYSMEIIKWALDGVIKDLDNAPTIDPVKHGHWTEDHKCSICHNEAFSEKYNIRPVYDYDWDENLIETGNVEFETDYLETEWCPYCGANMDEEVME